MSLGRLMFLVLLVALALSPPEAQKIGWAIGMVVAVVAFIVEQRRQGHHPEGDRRSAEGP